MSDATPLSKAAESYAVDKTENAALRLLIEIAFMEGAQWQTQRQINSIETELANLRAERAEMEAVHAQ